MISPYTHVTSSNVLPATQRVGRVTKEDAPSLKRGQDFDLITWRFARNPLFLLIRSRGATTNEIRVERTWFRVLKRGGSLFIYLPSDTGGY